MVIAAVILIAIWHIVMSCIGLLLVLSTFIVFAEVVSAATWRRVSNPWIEGEHRPSIAILIPAHNEELTIANAINSSLQQLGDADQLIVIADNCTDNTADVARRAGAEVVVRNDAVLLGKAYALNHGLNYLRGGKHPDVVIVVDADCIVCDRAFSMLSACCLQHMRPVQGAFYVKPKDMSTMLLVSIFARWVRAYVRPLGCARVGLPCLLVGSGMAFPWAIISEVELASTTVVEDLKLSLDFGRKGLFPVFCPEARVVTDSVTSGVGGNSQRARWEHGAMGLALTFVPRMLIEAVGKRDLVLFAQALDFGVPPLALLTTLIVGYTLIGVVDILFTGGATYFGVGLLSLGLLVSGVVLAWLAFCREIITAQQLALIPLYVLRKIPLYILFFLRRQRGWSKD